MPEIVCKSRETGTLGFNVTLLVSKHRQLAQIKEGGVRWGRADCARRLEGARGWPVGGLGFCSDMFSLNAALEEAGD